jgi:serine protease inhibitor
LSYVIARTTAAIAAIVVLFGSSAGAAVPPKPDLATAYTRFGFSLLSLLERADPAQNVFISPASIATALAMTANGAEGATREAILETLGLPSGVDMDAFNAGNADLLAALRKPGTGVELSSANALWLSKRFAIYPGFLHIGQTSFGATVQQVAFGEPSAAKSINAWVSSNTNGLIPEIVAGTSARDIAILTNAIAMKAKWVFPFEKRSTHDAPFTTLGGGHSTVSMMERVGSTSYAQDATWQIARLPYCCDDRFAMYVFLPREGIALRDALQGLDEGAFTKAIASLEDRQVRLQMPRYTATFKAALNEPLTQLGMGLAFSNRANFRALTAAPVDISSVNHRAFLRVDEDGTEAAAATAVVITLLKANLVPPTATPMIVNRPFFLAIRDDRTKQLLFAGAIVNPQK